MQKSNFDWGKKKKKRKGEKEKVVLNSFSPKKLNVSSSHKSLHALTTELLGHPAHAEQLLQNLSQFNVNIPKIRLNLFPPLLQRAL